MATDELPRILRKRGEPEYPTFVELFFDLVYIFMFTRLAQGLLEHMDLRNAAQTAVLLLAGWWVWVLTAWLTDLFNPRLPVIRGLVIVVMLGTMVMAATIPEAFDGRGLIFVLAYFAVHIARDVVLVPGTRVNRDIQARSIRVVFWLGVTAGPWLAGAFLHGNARLALWALAVAVDFGSARFGWPTPGLGRTDLGGRIFTGTHLSERHRQIVIVAFGELILTAGLDLAGSRFEADRVIVFGIAFGNAVLLFQLYFEQVRRLLNPEATGRVERVGPGTFTSYWHLMMVAGVVCISVSDRALAAHPSGRAPLSLALVTLGGPALFLAGSCLFDKVGTGRIPWSRLSTVIILFAITPAVLPLPRLVVMLLANLVLLATLIVEVLARQLGGEGARTSAESA